jgi:hypothetical protein
MGTSRNDPSPDIPPWRLARAALGRDQFSPERQAEALWRAAATERGDRLAEAFGDPALARACAIADERPPVRDALQGFEAAVSELGAAGLAVDMGRRALARTAAHAGDAADFAGELFAEAVSYYASRDLPSLVGSAGRVQSAAGSLELKGELRRATKARIIGLDAPASDPDGWRRYVDSALRALRGFGETP